MADSSAPMEVDTREPAIVLVAEGGERFELSRLEAVGSRYLANLISEFGKPDPVAVPFNSPTVLSVIDYLQVISGLPDSVLSTVRCVTPIERDSIDRSMRRMRTDGEALITPLFRLAHAATFFDCDRLTNSIEILFAALVVNKTPDQLRQILAR